MLAALFFWSEPLRDAFLQLAKFCFLPFGKEVISVEELEGAIAADQAALNKKLNLIWLPFGFFGALFTALFGLWVLLIGMVLLVTIVFSPLALLYFPIGIALLRLSGQILHPIGMKTVSKKQAQASAVANELERRSRQSN